MVVVQYIDPCLIVLKDLQMRTEECITAGHVLQYTVGHSISVENTKVRLGRCTLFADF
jgi:hypothetical protein